MDRVVAVLFVVLATTAVTTGTVVAAGTSNDTGSEPLPPSVSPAVELDCPPEAVDDPTTSVNGPPSNSSERATKTADHSGTPRIVELYPNPTTHRNIGEYVVLETPAETRLENWTLTDGHTTAALPDETVSGRVAVSTNASATRSLTDESVLELEGTVRLAVDGDTLELRRRGETLDRVGYDDAPVAQQWYRDDSAAASEASATESISGRWWPRDATCLSVSASDADEATAFVFPDAPTVPKATIRSADDRLLLAGYTITSETVAEELIAAADRGVDVAVLFESGPVGGTPAATEPVLETLEDGGVTVRAIGGEGARYRYHHPKYAVADDRILVTTENWKPSGTGGESSRGWGIRLADDRLAADLAAVFRADFEGWDTRPGAEFRRDTSFVDDETSPPRSFPSEHSPAQVELESAELLVAPDNAERRLLELVRNADEELLVKQASIAGDTQLLEETVDAARRGVDVRILLDSTWYHEDDNAALADDLGQTAADETLPLEVRLLEDTDRFEKIHAKGVVIDRETAVVGSANWNDNAFENNREVLIAAHGEEAAAFYADVFEDDWNGDGWTLPLELSATVVAALAVAAVVGSRYVQFGDGY
ncbi:phospholipase D-like domain-containing protein [Natronobacterium gregoryi]|uniref:Phosphatidylserine/phosphatidylglycerophosphate/ cardiolipin synthase n=2 Tax=Natronobacterium gregoryi TaxID=44930 RepID=L0AFI6_NATGS|nr:phospholipase D-like domain-containing protein [Natronobacterium gregoryi]AFZ71825.1 phosphatidylserine/phosphatidylglycerophosphate/cardiolipin synthase [Natronobacterium gregoryi SP2]ELY73001.1 phospholipase D/transphosphatidylase [Natronobacterium gregoryi SP2]PLK19142.1 phospholipase [Natronobacterium gregoryi SP2]SFJ60564.1 Phosphatidylserine/phosphatidylglycerophosphate/cardiolipin synthase [Natronobacterium gregoryi]